MEVWKLGSKKDGDMDDHEAFLSSRYDQLSAEPR